MITGGDYLVLIGFVAIIPGGVLLAIWAHAIKDKYDFYMHYRRNFYSKTKNSS